MQCKWRKFNRNTAVYLPIYLHMVVCTRNRVRINVQENCSNKKFSFNDISPILQIQVSLGCNFFFIYLQSKIWASYKSSQKKSVPKCKQYRIYTVLMYFEQQFQRYRLFPKSQLVFVYKVLVETRFWRYVNPIRDGGGVHCASKEDKTL